jgi:hypothetical protein
MTDLNLYVIHFWLYHFLSNVTVEWQKWSLNANFLANGQKFKNLSLPAKVPQCRPTLHLPPPTDSQQCPSPWKKSFV